MARLFPTRFARIDSRESIRRRNTFITCEWFARIASNLRFAGFGPPKRDSQKQGFSSGSLKRFARIRRFTRLSTVPPTHLPLKLSPSLQRSILVHLGPPTILWPFLRSWGFKIIIFWGIWRPQELPRLKDDYQEAYVRASEQDEGSEWQTCGRQTHWADADGNQRVCLCCRRRRPVRRNSWRGHRP